MTQEDKKLLLKDLCARLPYGVKVKVKYYDDNWRLLAIYTNGTTYVTRDIGYPIETYFEDCKPYLFPLSSMTDKEWEDYQKIRMIDWVDGDINGTFINAGSIVDWLNAHHFDFRDLIEKGLAIDATGLNIY